MPEAPDEFREELLDMQDTTPTLREGYQRQLDAMLHPPMTWRSAAPGVMLLVMLLVCVAGIIRAFVVYPPGVLVGMAWAVLALVFTWVSALIVRDLWRKKHSTKSAFSVAGALYFAAGCLTVVALIRGLRAPSDPASTFNALYVFVFYVACGAWSIESRIAAAELSNREQMLRLESRLVDLAERLGT
jgi:hypothetical protein